VKPLLGFQWCGQIGSCVRIEGKEKRVPRTKTNSGKEPDRGDGRARKEKKNLVVLIVGLSAGVGNF